LQNKYCLDNGRNAVSPIRMFKYLLLKSIFDLSDVDVVEHSKYDMSFKYFLDMTLEDPVINSSSLTKFRKLRLKDVNLLDMLIQKTVEIALEARYNQKSPKEILMEKSKLVRKAVYQVDETMKDKFPPKTTTSKLEEELDYCRKVIAAVESEEARTGKKDVNNNQKDTYSFDIEKCKICPFKKGCYKEGSKSKTYSVTIKSLEHQEQMAFQESDVFKEKAKERYKIEAKNSGLKHRHGYDVTSSSGLVGMHMQGAMAIFTVNLKRILILMQEPK
jgi:hypothetical protein